MIYAAYDKKTGERLWYEPTEAEIYEALDSVYKRDEYVIKSYNSFEDMVGIHLTDADIQAFNEAIESGEVQIRQVDD